MEPTVNENKAAGAPAALNAGLAADKRDAERYRHFCGSVPLKDACGRYWTKAKFDGEIDAVMEANV